MYFILPNWDFLVSGIFIMFYRGLFLASHIYDISRHVVNFWNLSSYLANFVFHGEFTLFLYFVCFSVDFDCCFHCFLVDSFSHGSFLAFVSLYVDGVLLIFVVGIRLDSRCRRQNHICVF